VKQKAFIKRIIDAAMLLLLPVLMAEILTGSRFSVRGQPLTSYFVFFDEAKSVFLFYAEVAAMIGMFIVAGHYFGMILQKWRCGEKQESKDQLSCGRKIAKVLAFCIPVAVIAVVIFP